MGGRGCRVPARSDLVRVLRDTPTAEAQNKIKTLKICCRTVQKVASEDIYLLLQYMIAKM